MNEKKIITNIATDFYELTRLLMGNEDSFQYLTTLSYSISNMVKLLDKDIGNELLAFIAEEIEAHNTILVTTSIPKGNDAFDDVAYKTKFVSGLENDLKISLCEHISDVLVDNNILR